MATPPAHPETAIRPAATALQDGDAPHADALERYIDGWRHADAAVIRGATAPGYRFVDPLVGTFAALWLGRYFEQLWAAFEIRPSCGLSATGFRLRGPMDAASSHNVFSFSFRREAPALGLTGEACLVVGRRGVVFERVSYDLNIALEMLRQHQHRVRRAASRRRPQGAGTESPQAAADADRPRPNAQAETPAPREDAGADGAPAAGASLRFSRPGGRARSSSQARSAWPRSWAR